MERRPRNQTADQGNLDQLFESVIAVRILRYLCQAGGSPTGRGIARAVAASHTAVARALQHLAEHEIVELRSVGRAITCTLNRAHWLAGALASLFQAEAAYRQQLGARIGAATRPAPVSVILFGSLAQGTMRRESDIDVLCVLADSTDHDQAEHRLQGAGAELRRTFGRPVNILVWGKTTFATRYRERHRLTREIVNSGEVIYGIPIMDLLR